METKRTTKAKKQLYELPLDRNGMPIISYSATTLKEIWDKTKNDVECIEVMKYLKKFIYKTSKPVGYTVWEYDESMKSFYYSNYTKEDTFELFVPNYIKILLKNDNNLRLN